MSFPRYPKYKDSGVEWLGEVPEHWVLNQGRRLFTQEREPARPTDDQLSATQKYGVVPQKLFMEMEDQKVALALNGLNSFKHVEAGDFVISLRSFQGGIERSAYPGCVSPAYTVLRPAESIDGRFWSYLLKSKGYIEALQSMTDGIRDGKNISYQQFGQIIVPAISLPEQIQIADFLDRETAKIDELVVEQRRLMELLKEKRQAIISHAVTQGLKPDVAMKPSGTEWLGDVPAHWDATPIKYVAKVGNGSTPSREVPEYWGETGFPWLNSSVVNARVVTEAEGFVTERALRECHLPIVAPPAILVGITGQGRTRGMAAMLGIEATINQHVAYVRPDSTKLDVRYLLRILESAYLKLRRDSEEAGATKGAITCEQIGNLRIPLPSLAEQRAISAFLDIETAKFDTLTAEAQHAIDLLQERRTALISAAVTGQIDVRALTERKAA
jgi:type I restriction enzyme S subunit